MTSRYRYAMAAAARGWHVFPIAKHDKEPLKGFSWEGLVTNDPDRIRRYWRSIDFNIGIACGPSGLVVVDLDIPKPGERPPPEWDRPGIVDGADVFAVLCEQAGQALPLDTFTVATRRGGLHLYYTAPDGVRLGNTSGQRGRGLGWCIDTRATGGYVVGPGSHVDLPDGTGPYEVIHNPAPAPLPAWLAARLAIPDPAPAAAGNLGDVLAGADRAQLTGYVLAALEGEVERVTAAPEGVRNDTLNTAAFALGQLVGAGVLPRDLAAQALDVAAAHTGLPERERGATIASGLTAGARHPRRVA